MNVGGLPYKWAVTTALVAVFIILCLLQCFHPDLTTWRNSLARVSRASSSSGIHRKAWYESTCIFGVLKKSQAF